MSNVANTVRFLGFAACLSIVGCAPHDAPRELVERHYAALATQDREVLEEIHLKMDWYEPSTISKLNQQRRSTRVVDEGNLVGPEVIPGDRYVTVAERFDNSGIEHKMNFWLRQVDGYWRIVAFNADEEMER